MCVALVALLPGVLAAISSGFPKDCPHCQGLSTAGDHVCGADHSTYENACYAKCYGVNEYTQGPCLPSAAASFSSRRSLKEEPSVLAEPLDVADDEDNIQGAASSTSSATKRPLRVNRMTPTSTPMMDDESLQSKAVAAAASPQCTPHPSAGSTQLYTTRACNESAPIYFAVNYHDGCQWRAEGFWKLSAGERVYYAWTRNRYYYLHAYVQQCYRGRCCSKLYWAGNHVFKVYQWSGGRPVKNLGSYGFLMVDIGPQKYSAYVHVLECQCKTAFCVTEPCCTCK